MAVWVLVGLLFSAMTAEWIGIHAIFGAFLLGAIIPHDSDVARDFQHKLEDIVKILLLPAFFAYTGMRTEIGLVSGWQAWGFTALIILVATLGKFGGTFAAARFTGLDWRMSTSLGILMNTRGLMELIVLNIGLEMGVISPTLFAMMVIMALVTTMTTTPVLQRLSAGQTAACLISSRHAPHAVRLGGWGRAEGEPPARQVTRRPGGSLRSTPGTLVRMCSRCLTASSARYLLDSWEACGVGRRPICAGQVSLFALHKGTRYEQNKSDVGRAVVGDVGRRVVEFAIGVRAAFRKSAAARIKTTTTRRIKKTKTTTTTMTRKTRTDQSNNGGNNNGGNSNNSNKNNNGNNGNSNSNSNNSNGNSNKTGNPQSLPFIQGGKNQSDKDKQIRTN